MDNHFHALRHWAQGYLDGKGAALPNHLAEYLIEAIDEIERTEERAERLRSQLNECQKHLEEN